MKKIIALLMILSIMTFICGCSKNETEDTNTETLATETVEVEAETVVETEKPYAQFETVTSQDVVNIEPLDEPVMVPGFTPICQLPELPTGCEITSLTMVLNHYGYNVDKCDLADNYLKKGEVGSTNFYKAFVGSPDDGASFGCYAPVIEDTANNYLSSQGSSKKARTVNGVSFSTLLQYIDNGIPVIVWGTLECQEGYQSVTWTVDGEDLTWITPEHCMVLVGYDDKHIYVADPMTGQILNYEIDLFIECFRTLYSQAVIIE